MKDNRSIYRLFNLQYKKVKHLLSKARSKEVLTFLFFLGLSFVFWILQSMNEDSEAEYQVPIEYINVPSDLRFTSTPPSHIDVSIKDKGVSLLKYAFGRKIQPIRINVAYYVRRGSDGVFTIDQDHIYSFIKDQLTGEAVILSVRPNPLVINYDRLFAKKLPIQFKGTILPKQQFQLTDSVRIYPDSIRVYATQEVLDSLCYVCTENILMSDVADTLYQQIQLDTLPKVRFEKKNIHLYVPVEEYTEKTMTLPLKLFGVPDSLTLRTFPSNIQISCFVDVHHFKELNASMFSVGVDFPSDEYSATDRLPVRLIHFPDFVKNIRLIPDSVEYIIEVNADDETAAEEDIESGSDRGDRIG